MSETHHSVRRPVCEAPSKLGKSGTMVGKVVSLGTPEDVEVGTRRVEVFFRTSIGSIMMGRV